MALSEKSPSSIRSQRSVVDRDGPRSRALASSGVERWLLRRVLTAMANPPIRVRLWDGVEVTTVAAPTFELHIHDRGALWNLLRNPELQFGEMYSDSRVDVGGDLVAFLGCIYRHSAKLLPRSPVGDVVRRVLMRRGRSNTLAGSRANIHSHYDLGNAFYSLWLDENLQYTCAYFPSQELTIEQAQIAKLDHICRKLRLQPGERVVEAGCGWGSLALHIARHYGCSVRAFNISEQQVAYARERAAAEGLQDRVEYVLDDYRTIDGTYDAFVSVGMLEHVGAHNYRELGRVIDRCLSAKGRALIHSIGRNRARSMNAWINRRIFPGAYPPTLREMMDILEPYDFSVLDVENLRLHYALTLEHWLDRFEDNVEEVRHRFDDRFVRMWRLYLAGSIAAFQSGTLQLFQVMFQRGQDNDVPWSREHLYAGNLR